MLVKVTSCRFSVNGKKKKSLVTDGWQLVTTAPIALMAIIAFIWSYHQMPHISEPEQYYDMLFWGGGHVLQLVHVQIVMITWLVLVKVLKPEFHIYKPHLYALFAIGVISALLHAMGIPALPCV